MHGENPKYLRSSPDRAGHHRVYSSSVGVIRSRTGLERAGTAWVSGVAIQSIHRCSLISKNEHAEAEARGSLIREPPIC